MKLLLAKFGNQIALLLAVAWFARSPDWEPGILAVTFFFAWVGMEVLIGRGLSKHDKILFEEFTNLLPSDGICIQFLKEHDIGNAFESSTLDSLDEFISGWKNAEHEFDNSKLEAQRKTFIDIATHFRSELMKNVFSETGGYLAMDLNDFETELQKLHSREELNKLATKVYSTHQEFIRLGRTLLANN